MNRAGYELSAEWFAPHFEFRFPLCGHRRLRRHRARAAASVEPWHVLGEEGAFGTTVALCGLVDRALAGPSARLDPARYSVGCNGSAVPLVPRPTAPTSTSAAALPCVAARVEPASDESASMPRSRSISTTVGLGEPSPGVLYHVRSPGRPPLQRFPVNSYEAESRRLARFFPFGHTPGPSPEPNCVLRPDFRTRSICVGRTELNLAGEFHPS